MDDKLKFWEDDNFFQGVPDEFWNMGKEDQKVLNCVEDDSTLRPSTSSSEQTLNDDDTFKRDFTAAELGIANLSLMGERSEVNKTKAILKQIAKSGRLPLSPVKLLRMQDNLERAKTILKEKTPVIKRDNRPPSLPNFAEFQMQKAITEEKEDEFLCEVLDTYEEMQKEIDVVQVNKEMKKEIDVVQVNNKIMTRKTRKREMCIVDKHLLSSERVLRSKVRKTD